MKHLALDRSNVAQELEGHFFGRILTYVGRENILKQATYPSIASFVAWNDTVSILLEARFFRNPSNKQKFFVRVASPETSR